METNKSGKLGVLIGILGVGLMILSIILLSSKNAGELFKGSMASILQIDLGLLLLVYGIKENHTKGKPKGNMYFTIGLAVLTSTAYTIYALYIKLSQ